jgi:phospholipid/cholesterol/gamma-HCH transport system permease protein
MVVTEQVAALRSLGTDPRQYLVLPRMLALMIMLPLLTVYTNAVGIIGGYLVCVFSLDLTPLFYFRSVQESTQAIDVFGGLLKAGVFGFLIAAISCGVGLRARGGSEAVGTVTKTAVVLSSIAVLASDFFLTRLLYLIS